MQTSSFIALILLDDIEIITPASVWLYFKQAAIKVRNTNREETAVVGFMRINDQSAHVAQALLSYRSKFLPYNAALLDPEERWGCPFKRVIFDLHSFDSDSHGMDNGAQE